MVVSIIGRRTLSLMVILFFIATALFAAGGHESEHASEEVPHGNVLPEISPVDLDGGESLACVATTSVVGDVVKAVAGDFAEVRVLMQVGQNPHSWEPTPRDLAAIESADILFVNGFDLEENLMESLEMQRNRLMVPISAGIEPLGGSGHDGHEEDDDDGEDHDHAEDDDHDRPAGDPHTWFSPMSVVTWVDNIEYALASADPQNAVGYAENAAVYTGSLRELDEEIRGLFAPIPMDERKLVVDHAALGYFARDYGFTVLGSVIPAVNDQAEPSTGDIADLIHTIEQENITAIFVGGTAGRGLRNLVDAVVEEIDTDIEVLTLLTGSLAPEGSEGDTYLEFARYNAHQIADGLIQK